MMRQTEGHGVVRERAPGRAVAEIAAMMLSLAAVGCRTAAPEHPWERYYDAERYGTDEEAIRAHFNLHRGRWWNYYNLGACYLEHKHYAKAIGNFKKAMAVRGDVETRDARTYGMHFVDYFPRREMGIALYFHGRDRTDEALSEEQSPPTREQLWNQAIAELTASLEQEESSRAKYYLNQTRGALWQARDSDRTPPTIYVKRPIHTNELTFRLSVTATDSQSYVEKLRVAAPDGGVRVNRPEFVVELARQEITEALELTIDPWQKAALVEIKAVDLAGNESPPYRVGITVDTEAPIASVTAIGSMQFSGRFAVFVVAADDSGLREIQVGADQNDRFSCRGERLYRGTVYGVPLGGELSIRIIDNAGNAVAAGVPVGEYRQARLSRTPWGAISRRPSLMERVAACGWNRCLSAGYGVESRVQVPGGWLMLHWDGRARTASFASSAAWAVDETTESNPPWFDFRPHVRPADDKPKETTQDFFVVEGTLRNAHGITAIKVGGTKLDTKALRRLSGEGGDLLFSHTLRLPHDSINQLRTIEVQACGVEGDGPRASLKVIRRENCVRDRDAIYQAVLLLKAGETPFAQALPDAVIDREVYDVVLTSLRGIRGRDPDPWGREWLERLRMHDVSVIADMHYPVIARKSVDHVLGKIGSGVDLIIHGDIGPWAGGGEEGLQITLRAMDVVTKADLQFRPRGGEAPVVLAEAFIPGKVWDESPDIDSWRRNVGVLARDVAEKLPRIQADARLPTARTAGPLIRIDRGSDHGLFAAMSLCFYTYGDAARDGNVYLKKIGRGQIADLDTQSSQVRSQLDPSRIESGCLVITK